MVTQGQHLVTTYFWRGYRAFDRGNQPNRGFDLNLGTINLCRFSKNRLDYFVFYLEYRGFDLDGLVYNTLATSFSISLQLGNKGIKGRDVLVCKTSSRQLSGQHAVDSKEPRNPDQKIVIPQKATLSSRLQLTSQDQHSYFGPSATCMISRWKTISVKTPLFWLIPDQIEALTYLVENLPNVTFRVAALTEMSAGLLSMVRYPNGSCTKISVKSGSKSC